VQSITPEDSIILGLEQFQSEVLIELLKRYTMNAINFGLEYLNEIEAEAPATRKCLERVPESLYDWKPHEKSMAMGYLALLVAEIPKWISYSIEKLEIDLATFPHLPRGTTAELVNHFDENIAGAKKALKGVSNEALSEMFYLKSNGQVVYSSRQKENIISSINHWVHHRGQLTVYLRLNNIAVPSIYGPSADDKGF
jgi:uncharacterized damage-inducible protein DinB